MSSDKLTYRIIARSEATKQPFIFNQSQVVSIGQQDYSDQVKNSI